MFLRFPGGKAKALTLSYDDGVVEDRRLLALMERHGIRGTFNLNSGAFAPEGAVHSPDEGHYRMSASDCMELFRSDCAEVACHALTHPFLEQLPAPTVMRELIADRENLERMTGKLVRGFAYPYGTLNDTVVELLRAAGFVYARTTVSTGRFTLPSDPLRLPATCHHNDPRLPELIEKFLGLDPDHFSSALKDAQLFYLWGHSYEFFDNDNWDVIETFFDRIGGQPDIWYATNIEVFDYIRAYHSLIFSVDQKICRNPTSTDVWVRTENETVRVPAGLTVRF